MHDIVIHNGRPLRGRLSGPAGADRCGLLFITSHNGGRYRGPASARRLGDFGDLRRWLASRPPRGAVGAVRCGLEK